MRISQLLESSAMTWYQSEMKSANFGDERLNSRASLLLKDLGSKPGLSIPAACGGWNETLAAYRFFSNEKVDFSKVLEPHRIATMERMSQSQVVLLVQDTSELDYSGQSETTGLGPLNYSARLGGYLHPTIAFTPEGNCLGVVDAKFWARSSEQKPDPVHQRARPLEEKESYRWIESYRIADEIAQLLPETRIISVCDREGDIYELFTDSCSRESSRAHWLVRAKNNRLLEEASDIEDTKLWSRVQKSPILGEVQFEVSATSQRKARTATQTLQALRVPLKPPPRKGKKLPQISVYAVLAREINPPQGEEPMEWMLLTSLTITSLEKACELLQYYLARWNIEIFFKVLKSGCQVEKLQLEEFERLKTCLAFYLIIAWRILFVTKLGRDYPDLPCSVVFDLQEWQAVYLVTYKQTPPDEPPPLKDMIQMVARLGGHLGRTHDGPPGPKTLWIGLQRARDFVIAIQAQKLVEQKTYV
jgi:hypothetical protein